MSMTPERWHEVKEVLASALQLDGIARGNFLHDRCAADTSLRAEVELLLEQQNLSSGFLNETALSQAAASSLTEQENPWIGRRVGAYQVVEQIGAGGMGEVYRAFRADDQYRKEAALKVIRRGQDSRFVVTRFKNERQVLASLNHPNIAALLDGGTTDDGLPYFVMELIDGQPFIEYCDAHKLTTSERLEKFLQVCAAVQYAHQRLIIHRDLKPSNILVTADGVPKLLDFGIAKILDAGITQEPGESTVSIFRVLTPSYASPEQIRGEQVTTASDVYSLGVLLYELLSGHPPYPTAGRAPHEVAHAVCEFEPEKPSSAVWKKARHDTPEGNIRTTPESVSVVRDGSPEKLSRQLRGDLDNIVLMSLRKEPQRRYTSVEQFASDISRHLQDLPVMASRDTSRYRASKFIIRHKAAVAAAAAITITLLVGLVITLHEVQIARIERARAEQRFRDIHELARSNLFELHDAIQKLPDSASARNLVIQRALIYLDKLSRDEAGDRRLRDELAAGYERVASLQDNFSGPGIGDVAAAVASYRKAFAIREAVLAASKDDVAELQAECNLLDGYLLALQESGNTGEALPLANRGLEIAELLAEKQPNNRETIIDEAEAHVHIALLMGGNGSSSSTRQLPEAIAHDRTALQLLATLHAPVDDPVLLRAILRSNWTLAYHLRKNRQFQESLAIYNKYSAMSNGFRAFPLPLQNLFFNYRSRLFDDMGDYKRAYQDDSQAVGTSRSLVRADPHDLNSQIKVALALGTLGIDEARLGNRLGGKQKLDQAIAIGERLLAANPQELYYQNLLLLGYAFQGEILSSMDKQAEAQAKYLHALGIATELAQHDAQDLDSQLNIAKIHVALAVVFTRARSYDQARQEIRKGSSLLDQLLAIRPNDAEVLYTAALTHKNLAAIEHCIPSETCAGSRFLSLPILNN